MRINLIRRMRICRKFCWEKKEIGKRSVKISLELKQKVMIGQSLSLF
jgi:hypothetical protein